MKKRSVPGASPPSSRQRAFSPAAACAVTIVQLGCAATQLEPGRNHPANPAAPTTQQQRVGDALDADFEPRVGATEPTTTTDPHAGQAKGEPMAPAHGVPMDHAPEPRSDMSPDQQRGEGANPAAVPGTKA